MFDHPNEDWPAVGVRSLELAALGALPGFLDPFLGPDTRASLYANGRPRG